MNPQSQSSTKPHHPLHPNPLSQTMRVGACCKYSHRHCTQPCLEGYDYCLRHILEDKTAPYRQCPYLTKAGKRCPATAPKLEKKEGLCAFHTKKALLTRQRLARKRRPRETADSLLEELVATTSAMDPHNNHEHRRGKLHSDSIATRVLEYASSSDSEAEPLLVGHAWRESGDSDAESIDSDQEDMLKYAGVYTTEEVAQILRDKLIRLQALYIDQFKRLKHVLLTKRQKYLQAQKEEKELYGSIKRYKKDPHQREKYEKLCAMKRYHKKFGVEALMQHKATQRRMKVTEGMAHKLPPQSPCVFVDEGLQCTHSVIPLSKFCHKHILHDQHQLLYRPCPFADGQCGQPVPCLLGNQFCSFHQALPVASVTVPVQEDVNEEGVMEDANVDAGGSVDRVGGKEDIKDLKTEIKEETYGSLSETGPDSWRLDQAMEAREVKCEVTDTDFDDGGVIDISGGGRDDDEDEDVRGLR